MTLQPHQQRVLGERDELGEKLEKLSTFLGTPTFDKLDRAEQFRLVRQRDAMRAYYRILDERIGPMIDAEVKQAQMVLKDQIVYGTGISLDGERVDLTQVYEPANLLSVVRKIRACESEVAALLALEIALSQRAKQLPRELSQEEIADIVRNHLTAVYHCTRVLAAWGVVTMSEDDFTPAEESSLPEEIAQAVAAARCSK